MAYADSNVGQIRRGAVRSTHTTTSFLPKLLLCRPSVEVPSQSKVGLLGAIRAETILITQVTPPPRDQPALASSDGGALTDSAGLAEPNRLWIGPRLVEGTGVVRSSSCG